MFTIEQIKAAHTKVKSGADYPNFVQDIIALGVIRYTTFISDGHTDYEGKDHYLISSGPRSQLFTVSGESDREGLIQDLKEHQAGKTDYLGFCRLCAGTGIEKWVADLEKMTCTYFDKQGKTILVEEIPVV